MSSQTISFGTLAGGAVEERFQQELNNVFKNILDPNTEHKVKRTVTLCVTISPNEGRTVNGVDFSVKSKLAPVKNVSSAFIIDEDGEGRIVSSELLKQAPGQTTISGTETPTTIVGAQPIQFKTAK